MQRPRLKANFSCQVLDGDKVFLVAEDEHYLVRGAVPVALLPYLDGRRTVAEIAEALISEYSPTQVFTAVRRYDAAGHLADGRPDLDERELAFWDAQGIDPMAVVQACASTEVTVISAGDVDPTPALASLRANGVRIADDPTDTGSTGLTVVLVDDYLDPILEEVNRVHLASGQPWLLARPSGVSPWAGPFLQPAITGCWACLAQRLSENRQLERYLGGKRGETVPRHPARATTPSGQQVLAGLLATEVVRILATGESAALFGTMVSLDLQSLQTTAHTLVRRPQCPVCGDETLTSQRSAKIVLSSRPARHTTDGGYRVQPPQLTFERLERHISPYLGAITRLGAHEQTSNGITYSFTAGHNFAMVNDNMDLMRRNMRGQSGGKGRSEIQAKVSALCEAIERYSAVWRGGEPVVRAAYDDLDPAAALHMDQLLHFSATQFEGRHEWNKDPRHRMQLVPDPFRTDVELEWSTGWSLTHDVERLLPAGYAWYGHPDLARHFYCVGDSNGGASGNTIEEAVLQGFCEVVERDAVAVWWYNRLRKPAFDLESLNDPYVETMRSFYAGLNRDVWALDLTSDLGIPAVAALSHREHDVEDIIVGFGAHPDPAIAAMRALTELNQFLPFIEQRDADGNTIYRTDDHETLAWCRGARLEREPWLLPDPDRPASIVSDYDRFVGYDLADHVRTCVDRAKTAGIEVIVLDQTQPDLDLSVVKVIAPGMRHFWRRLGPGRLYDVPVRIGALDRPPAEEGMNPWNVFF